MTPDEDPASPQIIGHRGASGEAPENTLAAFRLAWSQGADGIEGDFRLTRDNRIVCIHDRSTGRISQSDLPVAETDSEILQALDVGAWKGPEWKGERIPTLSEVMATVPEGKKLLVEVKSGPEILPHLEEEVARADLASDQLSFISFTPELVAALKRRFAQNKSLWIVRFEPRSESAAAGVSPEAILKVLSSSRADGLDAQAHATVDADFVDAIRSAGYELHLWSQEDPSWLEPFTRLAVDSITCNHPGALKTMLAGQVGKTREREGIGRKDAP